MAVEGLDWETQKARMLAALEDSSEGADAAGQIDAVDRAAEIADGRASVGPEELEQLRDNLR